MILRQKFFFGKIRPIFTTKNDFDNVVHNSGKSDDDTYHLVKIWFFYICNFMLNSQITSWTVSNVHFHESKTTYIYCGLSMTSLTIHTLFCFGRSIPFWCSKKGMDRPKQKRVWINQDVIDSPHCIYFYILAIMTTMESDQPDATTQWHVLTDRSQGATKIKPDELEIMVHRRLFKVST